MNRDRMLEKIEDESRKWDILIIGGGASGLGAGVDAAARGYGTLLLEQEDFSAGTSSRSTKLIHGGVRYLQQGNISLVMDALHERGILLANAPHIVRNRSFIVPNYGWWEGPFYGIGLKLYDVLAGKLGFGRSRHLSRAETLEKIPTLAPADLKGGVIYYDGQFDDARLAIALALTMEEVGGFPVNHMQVVDLLKEGGLVCGVVAVDRQTGRKYRIRARAVINATGIFVDTIRKLDAPEEEEIIAPSQGIHLVLDRSFLPTESAIMVPHTDDGRILFAVPWNDRVIIGTTDTPVEKAVLEPRPEPAEIEFLLSHAARYLTRAPRPSDVLSVFAGIRPLISNRASQKTSALSRDHHIMISPSGLVTVAGGKWTTYRKMGADAVDKAQALAGLPSEPSPTEDLKLAGWAKPEKEGGPLAIYGSFAPEIEAIEAANPDAAMRLHPRLPYRRSELIWAVRKEMALTLTDLLARRTRALILDAAASIDIAPSAARIMAAELGRDGAWERGQVSDFISIAKQYLLPPENP